MAFTLLTVRIHSHLCFAFVMCSVEYRLAPEHPFPAAVADAAAALRWARSHARAHGGDSGRIVLAGESAGGNVAAAAALANYDSKHTSLLGRTRLAGLWLLYPCLDYGHVYPSYLQYGSRDYPLLSLQYLLFYWSNYLGKDIRRTSLDYRAGTSDAGCPRSPSSFPHPRTSRSAHARPTPSAGAFAADVHRPGQVRRAAGRRPRVSRPFAPCAGAGRGPRRA